MKKIMIAICLFLILTVTTGCQWAAKNIGGSYTVELEPNQKLVNVTWKESQLWVLTKQMNEDDVAETYTFQEDTTMEILEGTVTIVEVKE